MKKALQISLLFSFVILLSSCGKDDDAVVTTSQLISGKRWITTSLTVNPPIQLEENQPAVSDLFSVYGDCRRDDIKFFNINNTYTFEEGNLKCFTGSPQVMEAGTWLLNSDETALVTIGDLFTNEPQPFFTEDIIAEYNTSYDIVEIGPDNLVLRYVWNFRDPDTGAIAASFALTQTHRVLTD